MTLTKRIIAAIPWSKAVLAFRDGDLSKSRRHFETVRSLIPLKPIHHAFDATLCIAEKRYESASIVFKLLLESMEIGDIGDCDSDYIRKYSRYYLSLSTGDKNHPSFLQEAKSCRPSKYISNTLPLP